MNRDAFTPHLVIERTPAELDALEQRERRREREASIEQHGVDRSRFADPLLEQVTGQVAEDSYGDEERSIARQRARTDMTPLEALRLILKKAERRPWRMRVRQWWTRRAQ